VVRSCSKILPSCKRHALLRHPHFDRCQSFCLLQVPVDLTVQTLALTPQTLDYNCAPPGLEYHAHGQIWLVHLQKQVSLMKPHVCAPPQLVCLLELVA